jgi:hypothetical protein
MKWNEITWYSRLGAIVLFLGVVPMVVFYIGVQYGQLIELQNNVSRSGLLLTPIHQKFVDPTISLVIKSSDSSDYDDVTHSFYRLIVRNTEYDPCLTLERVTLFTDFNPRVLHSERLCEIHLEKQTQSLMKDVSAVEYSNFNWDASGLSFKIDLSDNNGEGYRCRLKNLQAPEIECN